MSFQPTLPYLDYGSVSRVAHNNDDLSVVNAARVSFNKSSASLTEADARLIRYLATNNHWTPFGHARFGFTIPYELFLGNQRLSSFLNWAGSPSSAGFEYAATPRDPAAPRDPDETPPHPYFTYGHFRMEGSLWGWLKNPPPIGNRLLAHIYHVISQSAPISVEALRDPHITPATSSVEQLECLTHTFTNAYTFRIKAPIFVLRQLMRSNVGIVYNEVSRRYVDDSPQIFVPRNWRSRPEASIKQGSGDSLPAPAIVKLEAEYTYAVQTSKFTYDVSILSNLAPELARSVLPLATYSEVWMTATESALTRLLYLRGATPNPNNHAQAEIVTLAKLLSTLAYGTKPE